MQEKREKQQAEAQTRRLKLEKWNAGYKEAKLQKLRQKRTVRRKMPAENRGIRRERAGMAHLLPKECLPNNIMLSLKVRVPSDLIIRYNFKTGHVWIESVDSQLFNKTINYDVSFTVVFLKSGGFYNVNLNALARFIGYSLRV